MLDAEMSGQGDITQLEHATRYGRVFYTFNIAHFCHLHVQYVAAGNSHAGIIVVFRQRYSVGEQIRRLSQLISRQSAEELRDSLRFL